MSQVVSFEYYTPPARYDSTPWTTALIEEASTVTGPWMTIDTVTLGSPDPDPTQPASRSFTTDQASDTDSLWYRVTFYDASSGHSLPTIPIQNVPFQAYASVSNLARILKIRTPSVEQAAQLERVLAAAAGEINQEIGLTADDELDSWEVALCSQVNLDRAADLWRHTESIPGITGLLGDETAPAMPGRYSWNRYAERLAPVKRQWGLA